MSVAEAVELDVQQSGEGSPILVFPGVFNFENQSSDWIGALNDDNTVIIPTHPGFGANRRPAWCDSVDDLVYLYEDWVEEAGLDQVTLLGCSFGGWVALELAIRRPRWLSRLILVDSFGYRVGEPDERTVADIFAMRLPEIRQLAFADQDLAEKFLGNEGRSREEILEIAQVQEGAAVYGWSPYMHNPKLGLRLGRISVPTLVVWGSEDKIIGPGQGKALAEAIPGARFELIDGAGHAPHVERPDAFQALLRDFK